MAEGPVLAIDPGLGKCGLAVVFRPDRVVEQSVVPRAAMLDAVLEAIARHHPQAVVLGDRTGMKDARREIQPRVACPVVSVPEHETTLKARERFFRDNPRRGLKALVPLGLLTPPRPVDDYAAVLLAEKYWEAHPRR